MGYWRAILGAAIVAHALGWWLPAVRDYRGWQAFRLAFSPLWPFEQVRIEPGALLVLSLASALTNLLFIVLAVLLTRGGSARPVLFAAAGAALLNLHWPFSLGAQRGALEIGYFVWICSFALLALAAFARLRTRR